MLAHRFFIFVIPQKHTKKSKDNMNRALHQFGQKFRGSLHQLGTKFNSEHIHHLGNKIREFGNAGLRKGINTLSAVADGVDKVSPYLYGIAHAAGVGPQTMPVLAGVPRGAKMIREFRDSAQNVRRAINA